MFPPRSSFVAIKRKCEVVFQIVYNLIHNGQRKTPLHKVISQSIHDTYKSKSLIQMFNPLELWISYDDLERTDVAISQEIINLAWPNRVPVPKNIGTSSIIHGATDNFDHEENTLSEIGGSHDPILVLFQKPGVKNTTEKISTKSVNICGMSANKRSLSETINCQTLIKRGAFSIRDTVPANFKPARPPDLNHICMKSQKHYETWLTTRHLSNKIGEIENIPSFSAMNSFLHGTSATKTNVAFTQIAFYHTLQQNVIPSILLCVIFMMFSFRSSSHMVALVRLRCVSVDKRTRVFRPCTLWQHISGFRGFSYGESCDRMSWKILGRYQNRFNSRRKQSLWFRKC